MLVGRRGLTRVQSYAPSCPSPGSPSLLWASQDLLKVPPHPLRAPSPPPSPARARCREL